ncbi:MAG: hypothetical protein K9L59_09215 [Desulfobacterales bacterium]|nr:hypothetical protein [Desulfobacterales bacterium]MCF8080894.1 hypothetical protein [Desulfobacterales bacterium]
MQTQFLVALLVALVAVLLTVWVSSAREKHKKQVPQKQFNTIVLDDNGKKRYFSWHSRDPIHLIENEGQDQQLLDFLVPLRDAIYEHSDMKPQFSFPHDLKGEIVYEISPDFQSKWRLLGGRGDGPGDQVLVLLPPRHRS